MPKKTEEEVAARAKALESANHGAAQVPLEVLEASVRALELSRVVAREGNPSSVSDAGVAAACALAAAEGAALNVRINVPSIGDRKVADELLARQKALVEEARSLAAQARADVESVLGRA
jgi:glutamate formiminotransferase/formiminotetrahydrofolate cyclodeaminase